MTETIDTPTLETPEQDSLAKYQGKFIMELPKDLYIPPEALRVFLEAFEGPLDLLLYLIKKHNLDILNIPIAEITRQYMEYVEFMASVQLELVGEYLLMAAMLAEIKSRMLLPRQVEEGEEEDPRAELIRRLQEYECFKKAAEELSEFPILGRDTFLARAQAPHVEIVKARPDLVMQDLMIAFKDILLRTQMYEHHHVKGEALSVRERMSIILSKLQEKEFVPFAEFFTIEEGRMGVVVTFLAILELLKERIVELVQTEIFAPIHLKNGSSSLDTSPLEGEIVPAA
jgi:segregation and condensation protein A